MTYLMTRKELTCLGMILSGGSGTLPRQFFSFVQKDEILSIIDGLYKKGIITVKQPIRVDSVIAYLVNKIIRTESFFETACRSYTVCMEDELIIVLGKDRNDPDRIRIIPLEDKDSLDEFMEENGLEMGEVYKIERNVPEEEEIS